GLGDSISYDNLVQRITKQHIDKSSQFTDWTRRPLSDKQLTYAIGDVTHLRDCYLHIANLLEEKDRRPWIEAELNALMDKENYLVKPEEAWKRLKMKVNRPRDLAMMIELAAWRERKAQQQDVPRGRVVKDDAIYELAQQQPNSAKAFDRLRSFSKGFGRSSSAEEIIKIVTRVQAIDKDDLPKVPRKPNGPSPKGAIGDLLRVLLKAVSENQGVAPRIIASSDDIDQIVLDDNALVPALAGWRRDVFGDLALSIKNGKMALGATPDGIVPIEVDVQAE
ncbi:HRDC domain-containing protein, partial [uncultured Maritalea sp.]|uniref:ribonuclease D n=1 Tax=uncultured Maritalea sp. TaxID=757249 RepID=UPI0026307C8D